MDQRAGSAPGAAGLASYVAPEHAAGVDRPRTGSAPPQLREHHDIDRLDQASSDRRGDFQRPVLLL